MGTETVYDALGRVVETRRWQNVVIQLAPFVVNGQGQPVEAGPTQIPVGKRIGGGLVARNAWDGLGATPTNFAWLIDHDANPNTAGQVPNLTDNDFYLSYSRTEYDAAGRVYRNFSQNEAGQEICTQQIGYDDAGRQIQQISLPGSAQEAISTTEYQGTQQWKTVDARGNQTGSDPDDYTTTFEYDDLGRVVRTIHPATSYKVVGTGNTIGSASGPVYSHVGYDGFGRKLYETPPVASAEYGTADQYKIFAYDAAGRLTMVMMPKVDDPQDVPDRGLIYPIYRYYYDSFGNQIGILDPLGRVTVMEYDLQNRPVKKYQPYHVDDLGDLSDVAVFPAWSALVDVNVRPPNQPCEATIYDSHGRIEERIDCEGHSAVYRYYKNEVGSVDHFIAGTDFLGVPGQLRIEESYEGAPVGTPDSSIAYAYDTLGRKKTETVTPGTDVYKTWYDEEGRVEVLESPQGDLLYEYSPITGNKIATTSYPATMDINQIRADAAATPPYVASTTRTVYTYDDLGRLYTVQVTRRNGQPVSEAATTYGYNDNGSRGSVKLPNGVFTEYQYNAMNRLTEVVNYQTQPVEGNLNPTQLSRFGYAHYADGQRATAGERQKKTGTDPTVVDNSLSFQYDGLNRLKEEKGVGPYNADWDQYYQYAASYTYDLAGNRTLRHVEVTREDAYHNPVTEHLWTQYQYDMDNDRLELETHSSTQPVGMIPWGQGRAYAYAGPGGSLSFGLPGSEKRIGPFGAFWRGLPSVWNRYAMILLAALLPLAAFGPMLAQQWRRIRGVVTDGPRPTLSLYHRCLCVLFAYIFLVGPENFQSLASAEIQYSALSTATWGQSGDTITYEYDANGSLESKTTIRGGQTAETVEYLYDLRGQLKQVTTTPNPGTAVVTQYKYNPQGIRTEKVEAGITTKYLIDPYNHTGYAQVLEEWTGGTTPAVTYTIGDDVISQSVGTTVSHLIYDGHGSTRQLTYHPTPPTLPMVSDNFSYDAYGMMLGGNPTPMSPGTTKLLYAGEQFDPSLGHYYLRARYYNPSNGRFNQTDPFAGNPSDPQSLHKYLYCHDNPLNNEDPTGESIAAVQTLEVGALISRLIIAVIPHVMTGLLALTTVVTLGAIYELSREYLAAGAYEMAAAVQSNAHQIKNAIQDAAKALKTTVKNLLQKIPYFVFERFTPNIYKFTVSCLIWNLSWYHLTWHGNTAMTRQNRAWVLSQYGHLRGSLLNSIDEFPYASTLEGGWPFAKGCAVPLQENLIQGGYLKAHYYGILRKPMTKFLVLPVPR